MECSCLWSCILVTDIGFSLLTDDIIPGSISSDPDTVLVVVAIVRLGWSKVSEAHQSLVHPGELSLVQEVCETNPCSWWSSQTEHRVLLHLTVDSGQTGSHPLTPQHSLTQSYQWWRQFILIFILADSLMMRSPVCSILILPGCILSHRSWSILLLILLCTGQGWQHHNWPQDKVSWRSRTGLCSQHCRIYQHREPRSAPLLDHNTDWRVQTLEKRRRQRK